MRLRNVHNEPDAVDVLWHLLSERRPDQSISHKQMPTPQQHRDFIASNPYHAWYLIDIGEWAGACYLTRQREIGIGILKKHHGFGYGRMATQLLMEKHPGQFLANVNPNNHASARMFTELGFNLIQHTYAI